MLEIVGKKLYLVGTKQTQMQRIEINKVKVHVTGKQERLYLWNKYPAQKSSANSIASLGGTVIQNSYNENKNDY